MKFIKSLDIFHVDAKEIPCLTGAGAPKENTAGAPGALYMDTDTGDLYKCTAADQVNNLFAWKQLAEGNGNSDSTQNGKDGFSPIATVTQTGTGAVISITDKNGTTTATVTNGKDGAKGEQGPAGRGIVSIRRTSGNGAAGTTDVYTITYTDDTTSTFSVYNGANGKDGSGGSGGTGADGENGATFTPYVDSSGNLSWTNDKGLANPATVNIKGPKGDKGDKGETGAQGPQGIQGETGATGAKGEKGDKGDTGATGAAGYFPVRGTDYWTDADIAEIKAYVDEAILGGAW